MSPPLDPRELLLTSSTVYVPLSPAQRFWYLRLLNRVDSLTLNEIFTAPESPKTEEGAVLDVQAEGDATLRRNIKNAIADNGKQEGGKTAEANAWLKMMNLLMQLRKCCNHPFVLLRSSWATLILVATCSRTPKQSRLRSLSISWRRRASSSCWTSSWLISCPRARRCCCSLASLGSSLRFLGSC